MNMVDTIIERIDEALQPDVYSDLLSEYNLPSGDCSPTASAKIDQKKKELAEAIAEWLNEELVNNKLGE